MKCFSSFHFTNKNSHLCMHGYIWIIYGLYELWSPMFMRQVSLFPFLGSNKNERRLARKWKRERKLNKLEKWFGILWGCCIKTRQHIYIYVYIILKDKFAIKIKYVFHIFPPVYSTAQNKLCKIIKLKCVLYSNFRLFPFINIHMLFSIYAIMK